MSTADKNSVQLSVAGVLIQGQAILLALRSDEGGEMDGRWEIPGGKAEGRENAAESLIREFDEEFEIDVVPGEFLGSTEFVHKGIRHLVEAYHLEGSEPVALNVHDQIRWFDVEAIRELVLASPPRLVDSDRALLQSWLGDGTLTRLFRRE